jgi:hypothetical protein
MSLWWCRTTGVAEDKTNESTGLAWSCCTGADSPNLAADREFEVIENRLKEWLVTVTKGQGESVGMALDLLDSMRPQVQSVDPGGPIGRWNESAPPAEVVKPGDFIIAVNGMRGSTQAMIQNLKEATSLQILVNRPLKFDVAVKKAGTLGVDLDYTLSSISLLINAVHPGPVDDWNEAHPEREVCAKDRITSVNGISGPAKELLQEISNSTELKLGISRVSGTGLHRSL